MTKDSKYIKEIFYLVFALFVIFLIFVIISQIFHFIAYHFLLSISIIAMLWIARWLKRKTFLFKRLNFYFCFVAALAFYANLITGSKISLIKIFNALSYIPIIYEESDKTSSGLTVQNFRFPFWRNFKLRLWHDLPLRDVPFPSFYYPVSANFYYDPKVVDSRKNNEMYIHDRKEIICIFKNLGKQALLLNKIDIALKKSGGPFDHKFSSSTEKGRIEGLSNILNYKINTQPIILYPLEEVILFVVLPDIRTELLTIEIQIKYYDWPNQSNLFTYYQIDEVKFHHDSPRTLSARTKAYGSY